MCPCKTCFPNNESCIRTCNEDYVSCPLIEDKIISSEIRNYNSSNDAKLNTRKNDGSKDSFHILQQPTNLPTLTELYTEKAIEFMKTSSNTDKPFFLYIAYHQTHHPQFAGRLINQSRDTYFQFSFIIFPILTA